MDNSIATFNKSEPVHMNTENYIKKTVFLMEKSFEDVRQDEKHVPDLLEAIMRPPDPVKEELRQKLSKIDQFESKITKIRVCTFQMSRKIPDSANVAFEAVILSNPDPSFAIFGRASGQIFEKMRVLARRAGYPSLAISHWNKFGRICRKLELLADQPP